MTDTNNPQEPASNEPNEASAELEKLEQAVQQEAGSQEEPEATTPEQETSSFELGQGEREYIEKKGFKDGASLVQSYQNLERRLTQAEQTRKGAESKMGELQAQMESLKNNKDTSPEQQQALKLLESTVEKVLQTQLKPIRETIGAQKVQSKIEAMEKAYPWASSEQIDTTLDYMVAHPNVPMEDAFRVITWDSAQSQKQQAQAKQAQQQQNSRAFVEPAGGTRTGKDIDYSKLSLEEMEDILPKNGSFIDAQGNLR